MQDNPSLIYSYDIESGKWRGHGKWGLPFFGQVHFDKELDAWVGLHRAHEYPDGYIWSCDVISPTESHTKPAWKLCKEMMFDPDAAMRLYMDRHIPVVLCTWVTVATVSSRSCRKKDSTGGTALALAASDDPFVHIPTQVRQERRAQNHCPQA